MLFIRPSATTSFLLHILFLFSSCLTEFPSGVLFQKVLVVLLSLDVFTVEYVLLLPLYLNYYLPRYDVVGSYSFLLLM